MHSCIFKELPQHDRHRKYFLTFIGIMKRSAYPDLAILSGVVLLLFYPLFYTHYFYTDEIVQLTHYRKGTNFHMFAEQGRYLTDRLFQSLFSAIDTIGQITRLRLISLLGWMVCIPVWYTILTRVCRKEELPPFLPFFTVLYLIVCPPFCVSVSWASCMELFIANTSGLVAGYALYSQIRFVPVPGTTHKKMELPARGVVLTLLFGVISLFTYQNGFGCFLLPFLLQAIAKKEWSRSIVAAIGMYFFTYLLYYMLFKWQLHFWQTGASTRTGFAAEPLSKILFFLGRPLATAFHFTWIVNERSLAGKVFYALVFVAWLLLNLFTRRPGSFPSRLRYLAGIFCLLILIYLPSLIVKENYASNRTLLALDMTIFLLVFTTLLQWVRMEKNQLIMANLLGIFLVANAWYNFRYQFLGPVKKEYDLVRNYMETGIHSGITNVTFIRPTQDLFGRKYGVNISWDEFGVPSTYPGWVPEDFVRQVVFEKTGDRAAADKLVITNWPDKQTWLASRPSPGENTFTVDVESIMR